MDAARSLQSLSRFEQLRFAREVVRNEGDALLALAASLPESFCDAVEKLHACRGSVVVTGMGKAGLIGQKITATLASVSTRCHFLHPGEAVHGDLGRVQQGDVILALSFSGETEELLRLLPSFRRLQTAVVAVTGNVDSSLARAATIVLSVGTLREVCPFGLAPTTSTTAMLALGDALALVLGRMRGFSPQEFALNHPAGNLGRRLARVDELMRPLADCRLATDSQTIREVLVMSSRPGRRTGAIMLVDQLGALTGLFTDSDLARILERRHEDALDRPIRQVMTPTPCTVSTGSLMARAIEMLVERKISELPVVDDQGKPAGLIDITDVVGWLPASPEVDSPRVAAEHSVAPIPNTVPFSNRAPRQSRR